jgi:hypothetical protein
MLSAPKEAHMNIIANDQRWHSARARKPDATGMSTLGVICLWSIAGLILTALFIALGLRSEIADFLTLAG